MRIVGRKKEIEQLLSIYDKSEPAFVAITGRRRVGKTFLIRETFKNKITFELTGIQDASKEEQLTNFAFAFQQYYPENTEFKKPKDWIEAFHQLATVLKRKKEAKNIVFLDELPWLGSRKSGFLKGLSFFWNSYASKENILLIVCGSAASWIVEKILNNKGGLHNRITSLIHLEPFTLGESEAFCESRNIKLDRNHILQIYMVMGGIPMYLNQLQPGLSAIQNLQHICFERTGFLFAEFDRLFASLFINHENHVEIIRALAIKRKGLTRKEVIQNTSLTNGGMLSKILRELDQSGFIQIYGGYGKKTKDSLYRLTDPFSLFYLSFMEKLGPNSKQDLTKLSDLPTWRSWNGYAYENISLMHIDQIKKALGIHGISTSMSSFVSREVDGIPGAQIDLLIERGDQSINICEIKYSEEPYILPKSEVNKIDARKLSFKYHTKTKKHLFTTLITTHQPVKNALVLNHIDQVVDLDNLFEE